MNKICGIVAEYNPFHKGHEYQIQKTKELINYDVLIVVMSGNFVQRGEPAMIHKWKRAEHAIRGGVNIVVELPYLYSTQSASQFAHGATRILKHMGITHLSFGSECGNLENLQEIADTSVNPDHLHVALNQGMSYPKSYRLLTTDMYPNDILGVCYLKEIKDTSIQPILITRTNSYTDESLQEISSASAIRKAIQEKKDVSLYTPMAKELSSYPYISLENYYPYLRTFLLTSPKEYLQKMFLVSEGIENHIVKCAKENASYEGFIKDATNWRYTSSRIRRTCLQMLLQLSKEEVQKLPTLDSPRILAFDEIGRSYLHQLKKQEVSYSSRFAKLAYPYRTMEYRSTLLYTSIFEESLRQEILDLEIGGALYIKEDR
ncbi:MAG: nucleotidyltransferase family protein [Solobacterium sp.]|nr:nucleotidyltransferase family protein [Solobacterium sp.]